VAVVKGEAAQEAWTENARRRLRQD
jgi:hypothetical protein